MLRQHKPSGPFRWFTLKHIILTTLSVGAICIGLFFLWASTLTLPNIQSFEDRQVGVSTRIYDRTGTIVLYDLNQNTRRTVVTNDQISPYIKNGTVAIEDEGFYSHSGISFTSIIRAFFVDLVHLSFSQGGSTITQQVVKNSLLSTDKKISRKIKEWILAINLERIMTKDQILNIYLNETPYGGNIYGVEEASEAFLGKKASDVTIAEAAYLAALPQAPSYFSPYGNHRSALDDRKNLVLSKMFEYGMITQAEYTQAKAEKVVFQAQHSVSIKAPHFVMYVKEYLEQKYGVAAIAQGGYKIITTLDYDLQQKAEEIVKRNALSNAKKFKASNAALVAIDPKTGQILTMVGSRDYFDTKIDGNFNVTTAYRQPGSSFKPFVYATAFEKGYLPDTVVFDLQTEFSTTCNPDGTPMNASSNCYHPENYDGNYLGPISFRNALAQSRNIPAIKALYLTGIADSLQTAKNMGITSLKSPNDYGLTLVLGGGEVSPLEMTSAYGVFATGGIRNDPVSILKVLDRDGNTLEEYQANSSRVIDQNVADMINDVLSDETARQPEFGYHSALYVSDNVAVKTGTTNDYRDTWIVGYSPTVAVGAWAGNNDNSAMEKKIAGFIVAPLWNEFMKIAVNKYPKESFEKPIYPDLSTVKPVIRGEWDHGNPHDILYYVDKNDPAGPPLQDPSIDPQEVRWEYAVQNWVGHGGLGIASSTTVQVPIVNIISQ